MMTGNGEKKYRKKTFVRKQQNTFFQVKRPERFWSCRLMTKQPNGPRIRQKILFTQQCLFWLCRGIAIISIIYTYSFWHRCSDISRFEEKLWDAVLNWLKDYFHVLFKNKELFRIDQIPHFKIWHYIAGKQKPTMMQPSIRMLTCSYNQTWIRERWE